MDKHTYSHGLPFTQKLRDNIQDQKDRIQHRKASLMITTGGVGEGKTTLAVEMADYYNSLHGLPPIDLKSSDQLAQGGAEFTQKLRVCFQKKLPVLVYDEAGDFSRRGSLSKFNAMLNRTFETFRAFRILVILCLPNFHHLDQALFDNQIPRLLLRLHDRSDSYGNFDAYGLYRMLLLRARMDRMKLKNYAYSIIRPNFYGNFLDLDHDRAKQLDRITTKSKLKILQVQELEMQGLLSYSQMATKLMRSIEWVKAKVSKLKLNHTRIIKQAKYFNEDTLNRLAEEIENDGRRRPREGD